MDSNEIGRFYQENGYYVARGVFSPTELTPLEEDFDHIVAQLKGGKEGYNARWGGDAMAKLDGGASEIVHTHNVQQYSSRWMRALLADSLLDPVEAMIGPDIVLHHTKLFQKPAEKGSPFPIHQDWTYFPSFEDTMMAGIVHVSEATDEMGCLRVYPGSHLQGRVDGTNGAAASEFLDRYPLENAEIVECEPGDIVFFNYLTLHGSMPNRSNRIRKTVLVQLYAGTDAIEPSGASHPNARLALRGWNYRATRTSANQLK